MFSLKDILLRALGVPVGSWCSPWLLVFPLALGVPAGAGCCSLRCLDTVSSYPVASVLSSASKLCWELGIKGEQGGSILVYASISTLKMILSACTTDFHYLVETTACFAHAKCDVMP